jgi:hypothetical protein
MRERRTTRRFACDANVELEWAGGERLMGRATDVSMGGMGVQLGAAVVEMLGLTEAGGLLEPDTPSLKARIRLREDGPADVLALRGVPRHVRRLSRDTYRMGVQLVVENPEQAQALQAWVDRLRCSSDARDA